MATYYAWTRFQTERDGYGRPKNEIMPGEEVTAETLGITDEQFSQHIKSGAVRKAKYPVPSNRSGVSPAEHMKARAIAMAASADIEAFDEPEDEVVEQDVQKRSMFSSVS